MPYSDLIQLCKVPRERHRIDKDSAERKYQTTIAQGAQQIHMDYDDREREREREIAHGTDNCSSMILNNDY